MTDTDSGERSVSSATILALNDAVTMLRIDEGMLLAQRTITNPDLSSTITALMVGETEDERPGQFLVVLNKPESEFVPINRDVHILTETGILSLKIKKGFTDEEVEGVYDYREAKSKWLEELEEMSIEQEAFEMARFERADASISRSLEQLNDLKDLSAKGDIDDDEFDKRVSEIPIHYGLDETDADKIDDYQAVYLKFIWAHHSYQMIVDGMVRDADIALEDILNGDTPLEEEIYMTHLSEGEVWNIINMLDGVSRKITSRQPA